MTCFLEFENQDSVVVRRPGVYASGFGLVSLQEQLQKVTFGDCVDTRGIVQSRIRHVNLKTYREDS